MSPAEMPAGRELDALVAGKVMGWESAVVANYPWQMIPPGEDRYIVRLVPHYSTDITAAWLVVERMRAGAPIRFRNISLVAYCYHRTYATFDATAFTDYSPETWAEANGEHATPLAICRAALMACAGAEFRPDTLSAVREAETECHDEGDA
jgi:hypothetical protein